MIRALPALLLATSTSAQPMFEDRSNGLPTHIYAGGWEHFVGGGIAVVNRDGVRLMQVADIS